MSIYEVIVAIWYLLQMLTGDTSDNHPPYRGELKQTPVHFQYAESPRYTASSIRYGERRFLLILSDRKGWIDIPHWSIRHVHSRNQGVIIL